MKFKVYSLDDLLKKIIDNRGKTCPTSDNGIPLIATNCIRNENLYPSFEKIRYVSDDTYINWFRGHPKPSDIIFVCKGSPGRTAWYDGSQKYCIAQDMVALRANEDIVLPKYLFALLRSEYVQNKISNMHVGSLIPHFKKGDFKNLKLEVIVDLEIQKRIGDIYFDFLKKIQLNKETNQTLEAIAQALFKSWFIDFDPVRAKAEALAGGKTKTQATIEAMKILSGKTTDQLTQLAQDNPKNYQRLQTTAEAFPSGFDDTGIPLGWEYTDINSIAYLNDKSWTKKTAPAEVDYVDLSNTKWGVILSSEKYAFKSAPSRARRILRTNDTIVGTVRPANGAYAFIKSDGLTGSTGFAVLSPKEYIFSEFIYLCLTRKENIEELARLADGGAYPAVKSDVVAQTPCILPSGEHLKSDILESFHLLTRNLFVQKDVKLTENETLANTRDNLLPKLLNGEIEI